MVRELVLWKSGVPIFRPSGGKGREQISAKAMSSSWTKDESSYRKVSSTISSGEIVKRISCVVYTHPSRHAVKVLKTTKAYKYEHSSSPEFITLYPGTIVYLLQYTGEGTYLALWNGQLLWWLEGYNISGFTNANPSSPWGVYLGEATDASLSIDFWMCLRKADGTVGWAHPKDYPSGTFNQYWK